MRLGRMLVIALIPPIVAGVAGYKGRQVDTRTVYATEFGSLWPYGSFRSGSVRCFPRTVMGKKVPMTTIRLGKVTYGLNDVAHFNFGLPSSDIMAGKTASSRLTQEGIARLREEGALLCGGLGGEGRAGKMTEGSR